MEKIFLVGSTIFASIILFISTFWVNKFSNNGIIFGVRVPKEYEKEDEILKLEKEYKTKAFVKIDGDQVKVVVNSKKHDTSLANQIMRTIQSNYENKMYITVQFKG